MRVVICTKNGYTNCTRSACSRKRVQPGMVQNTPHKPFSTNIVRFWEITNRVHLLKCLFCLAWIGLGFNRFWFLFNNLVFCFSLRYTWYTRTCTAASAVLLVFFGFSLLVEFYEYHFTLRICSTIVRVHLGMSTTFVLYVLRTSINYPRITTISVPVRTINTATCIMVVEYM